MEEVRERLFAMQDASYRDFMAALIPSVKKDAVIGVRTPELRKFAKELSKRNDIGVFLKSLPHKYFEENQLHAFIIGEEKDFTACLGRVEDFLPYIDNWATCDQMSPKVFARCRKELVPHIFEWISSSTYKIRFGIKMLMQHFLDEDFDAHYLEAVSKIRSDEYYVNMMVAWYFATALAKRYDEAVPYIEGRALEPWTHNKTIQKARESYRIPPEKKEYLAYLKVRQ